MKTFKFETLEAWMKARNLNKEIYRLTEKFPKSEMFGLTNQVRRASISVCSNLAEGSGRITKKEKAHFYAISYSSLLEVCNQLIIATDLGYIEEKELAAVRLKISNTSFFINELRKSQLSTNLPGYNVVKLIVQFLKPLF